MFSWRIKTTPLTDFADYGYNNQYSTTSYGAQGGAGGGGFMNNGSQQEKEGGSKVGD